jgi:hypothetical protein
MAKFAGRAFIRAAGVVVSDITSLGLAVKDGNSDVDLLLGGGGFASGNLKYEVDAEGALGTNGWNTNWVDVCAAAQELTLDFVLLGDAGEILTIPMVGDVREPGITANNNSAVTYKFKFHGRDPR